MMKMLFALVKSDAGIDFEATAKFLEQGSGEPQELAGQLRHIGQRVSVIRVLKRSSCPSSSKKYSSIADQAGKLTKHRR